MAALLGSEEGGQKGQGLCKAPCEWSVQPPTLRTVWGTTAGTGPRRCGTQASFFPGVPPSPRGEALLEAGVGERRAPRCEQLRAASEAAEVTVWAWTWVPAQIPPLPAAGRLPTALGPEAVLGAQWGRPGRQSRAAALAAGLVGAPC